MNEFQILANAIIDLTPRQNGNVQNCLIYGVEAELEVRT